jgi:hypothetical protein
VTNSAEHQVVQAYFAAMRQGSEAEADMMALFTTDAVYIEPFSGTVEPAVGLDAIRRRFQAGWVNPPPDMELRVLAIEVTGDQAVSHWECRSPAFPSPVLGRDVYELRNGKIASLKVTIDSSDDHQDR